MTEIEAASAGRKPLAELAIDIPYVVPAQAEPLAFGVSALIGVIFGVVPARKAAR